MQQTKVNEIKNAEEFFKILGTGKASIFMFHASWCGPCKKMEPILNSFLNTALKDKYDFYKIDVDTNPYLVKSFCIFQVPTIVVIKDHEVISKFSGFRPPEELYDVLDVLV